MRAIRGDVKYDPREYGARCDVCPLRGHRQVMPSPNLGDLECIIVGEGPGRREEIIGKPFIGVSGKLLDRMLERASILRHRAWITNAMLCRGDTDAEKTAAEWCCAPRLLHELAQLPTVPIIALGKPSTRAILGTAVILLARGFIWRTRTVPRATIRSARAFALKLRNEPAKRAAPWAHALTVSTISEQARAVAEIRAAILEERAKLKHRTVLPTIHPAFVLRLETWATLLECDLKRAGRVIRGEVYQTDDYGKHVHLHTVDAIKRCLPRLGKVVGFDIEADGADPLLVNMNCIGFSDAGGDGPEHTYVIHPWDAKKFGPIVSEFFHTDRIFVGHNIMAYDTLVLERMGTCGVKFDASKLRDTILAHHAYVSHFPPRLDQLVSEYCDSAPWKIRYGRRGGADEKGLPPHKMPGPELRAYNAADCRLVTKVWHAMQQDLEKERYTYELDFESSRMCKDMQRNGILVDNGRRLHLEAKLRWKERNLLSSMRAISGMPDFTPTRYADIRKAIFERMGVRPQRYTTTGLIATSVGVLQGLRCADTSAGKLAGMILDYKGAHKVVSTYLKNIDEE